MLAQINFPILYPRRIIGRLSSFSTLTPKTITRPHQLTELIIKTLLSPEINRIITLTKFILILCSQWEVV